MRKPGGRASRYSVFDVNGVNIYTSNTTGSSVSFKDKVSISDLNIRKVRAQIMPESSTFLLVCIRLWKYSPGMALIRDGTD